MFFTTALHLIARATNMKEETMAGETVTKKDQLYMHLIGANRYVVKGVLYTADVAYPVTPEQLEAYEEHRCDGKQMFARYVKPKKVVKVSQDDSTPVVDLPTLDSAASIAEDATPLPRDVPQGIEIGTDEELAELGLDKDISEVA